MTATTMPNPISNRVILLFGRFAIVLALGLLPWPGLNELYATYFRSLGNAVFHREQTAVYIRFAGSSRDPRLDSSIDLGNRRQKRTDGGYLVRTIGFHTRAIGYLPTLLALATIVAVSRFGPALLLRLLLGILLMQAWLILLLGVWILHEYNQEPELQIFLLPGPFKAALAVTHELLVGNAGPALVPPVVLGLLVGTDAWSGNAINGADGKPHQPTTARRQSLRTRKAREPGSSPG